jgi:hypothetical protein
MSWRSRLPDGTLWDFPDDVTEQDVAEMLHERGYFPNAPSGLFAATKAGFTGVAGRLGALPNLIDAAITGDEAEFQQGVEELRLADEAERRHLPFPTRLDDVTEAWDEGGISNILGTGATYASELVGLSSPYLIPQTAATRLALPLASRAIPALARVTGPAARPGARLLAQSGAGVSSMVPVYLADNLQRQVQSGVAEPEDLDLLSASLAAAGQSAAEQVFVMLMGGQGRALQRNTVETMKDWMPRRIIEGLTEAPVEVIQQTLERLQAGETIDPRDEGYMREMVEAFVGGAVIGPVYAGGFGLNEARQRKKAREQFLKAKPGEEAARAAAYTDAVKNTMVGREEAAARAEGEESLRRWELGLRTARRDGDAEKLAAMARMEQEETTPEDVHAAARARNIESEDDGFLAFSQRVAGKRHLDDMTPQERRLVYNVLTAMPGRLGVAPYSMPLFSEEEYQEALSYHRPKKGVGGRSVKTESIRQSLGLFTGSDAFNINIAKAIEKEMKKRHDVSSKRTKDGKLSWVAKRRGYSEEQYQHIINEAINEGVLSNAIIERITRKTDKRFLNNLKRDAVSRGDVIASGNRYVPVVDFDALTGVYSVKEEDGFLVRDTVTGEIVGGARKMPQAKKLAAQSPEIWDVYVDGVRVSTYEKSKSASKEKTRRVRANPGSEVKVFKRAYSIGQEGDRSRRIKEPMFVVKEKTVGPVGQQGTRDIEFFSEQASASQKLDVLKQNLSTLDPRGTREDEARTAEAARIDLEIEAEEAIEPPEAEVQRRETIHQILQDALSGMGMDDVRLQLVDRLAMRGAEAMYLENRLIQVALDHADPRLTPEQQGHQLAGAMNHELFHALVDFDLLHEGELSMMGNYALRAQDPDYPDGVSFVQGQINRREGLPVDQQLNEREALEEGMSQAFRKYKEGALTGPDVPSSAFDKIAMFFDRLGNHLAGLGFKSSEDVFDSIRSGHIGTRERGVIRNLNYLQNQNARERNVARAETDAEDIANRVANGEQLTTAEFVGLSSDALGKYSLDKPQPWSWISSPSSAEPSAQFSTYVHSTDYNKLTRVVIDNQYRLQDPVIRKILGSPSGKGWVVDIASTNSSGDMVTNNRYDTNDILRKITSTSFDVLRKFVEQKTIQNQRPYALLMKAYGKERIAEVLSLATVAAPRMGFSVSQSRTVIDPDDDWAYIVMVDNQTFADGKMSLSSAMAESGHPLSIEIDPPVGTPLVLSPRVTERYSISDLAPERFYSALERALEAWPKDSISANELKSFVRKGPKAFQEEFVWSGLDGYIDARRVKSFDKKEILTFLLTQRMEIYKSSNVSPPTEPLDWYMENVDLDYFRELEANTAKIDWEEDGLEENDIPLSMTDLIGSLGNIPTNAPFGFYLRFYDYVNQVSIDASDIQSYVEDHPEGWGIDYDGRQHTIEAVNSAGDQITYPGPMIPYYVIVRFGTKRSNWNSPEGTERDWSIIPGGTFRQGRHAGSAPANVIGRDIADRVGYEIVGGEDWIQGVENQISSDGFPSSPTYLRPKIRSYSDAVDEVNDWIDDLYSDVSESAIRAENDEAITEMARDMRTQDQQEQGGDETQFGAYIMEKNKDLADEHSYTETIIAAPRPWEEYEDQLMSELEEFGVVDDEAKRIKNYMNARNISVKSYTSGHMERLSEELGNEMNTYPEVIAHTMTTHRVIDDPSSAARPWQSVLFMEEGQSDYKLAAGEEAKAAEKAAEKAGSETATLQERTQFVFDRNTAVSDIRDVLNQNSKTIEDILRSYESVLDLQQIGIRPLHRPRARQAKRVSSPISTKDTLLVYHLGFLEYLSRMTPSVRLPLTRRDHLRSALELVQEERDHFGSSGSDLSYGPDRISTVGDFIDNYTDASIPSSVVEELAKRVGRGRRDTGPNRETAFPEEVNFNVVDNYAEELVEIFSQNSGGEGELDVFIREFSDLVRSVDALPEGDLSRIKELAFRNVIGSGLLKTISSTYTESGLEFPFSNWTPLVIKSLIMDGVRNGYKYVAWPDGTFMGNKYNSAARDIASSVEANTPDAVAATKGPGSNALWANLDARAGQSVDDLIPVLIHGYKNDIVATMLVKPSGEIVGDKGVHGSGVWTKDNRVLSDVIGGGLSAELLGSGDEGIVLSGVDMLVGDTQLTNLYDISFVTAARDLSKRLGLTMSTELVNRFDSSSQSGYIVRVRHPRRESQTFQGMSTERVNRVLTDATDYAESIALDEDTRIMGEEFLSLKNGLRALDGHRNVRVGGIVYDSDKLLDLLNNHPAVDNKEEEESFGKYVVIEPSNKEIVHAINIEPLIKSESNPNPPIDLHSMFSTFHKKYSLLPSAMTGTDVVNVEGVGDVNVYINPTQSDSLKIVSDNDNYPNPYEGLEGVESPLGIRSAVDSNGIVYSWPRNAATGYQIREALRVNNGVSFDVPNIPGYIQGNNVSNLSPRTKLGNESVPNTIDVRNSIYFRDGVARQIIEEDIHRINTDRRISNTDEWLLLTTNDDSVSIGLIKFSPEGNGEIKDVIPFPEALNVDSSGRTMSGEVLPVTALTGMNPENTITFNRLGTPMGPSSDHDLNLLFGPKASLTPWSMSGRGEGDLYITRVGTKAGTVYKQRENANDIAFSVDKSVLDVDFMYYLLQFLQPKINARRSGAAIITISQSDVSNVLMDHFQTQRPKMSLAAMEESMPDSVVRGEDGKLKKVYHGTTDMIDTFIGLLSSHFGTADAANDRLLEHSRWQTSTAGQRIYPVYLNITNPIVMTDMGEWNSPMIFLSLGDKTSEGNPRYPEIVEQELYQEILGRVEKPDYSIEEDPIYKFDIMQMLEEAGYDGIVYENAVEDPGSLSYIPMWAPQIKFAYGPTGEEAAEAPSIVNQPEQVVEDPIETVQQIDPNLNDNGTIKPINVMAPERNQKIASGEIKGEKLSENQFKKYSMAAGQPAFGGNVAGIIKRIVSINKKESIGQKIMKLMDKEQRKDFFLNLRIKALNQYEKAGWLDREIAEKTHDDTHLLAAVSSMAAALNSDKARGMFLYALEKGVPYIKKWEINGVRASKVFMRELEITMPDGSKGVGGLRTILTPLLQNNQNLFPIWSAFMIARREHRFEQEGRPTRTSAQERAAIFNQVGYDPNSKRFINSKYPNIELVANNYKIWNDAFVDFMSDAGIVTPELAQVFKDYADYFPFYRQLDGESDENLDMNIASVIEEQSKAMGVVRRVGPPVMFNRMTGAGSPRVAKGGETKVNDPLENMMQNAFAGLQAGLKNISASKILRNGDMLDLVTEVNTVDESTHTIRIDGEDKYFRVTDVMLYETLAGTMESRMPWLNLISIPSNVLRNLITRSPDFLAANLLRDTGSAWVTSGAQFSPFVGALKNMFSGKDDPKWQALERSGLAGGFDNMNDVNDFQKYMKREWRSEKIMNDKNSTWNFFAKLWQTSGEWSTRSDMAVRMDVWQDVVNRMEREGKHDRATIEAEADFQAMEVINFSRRGASPYYRILTAMVPFTGARFQGIDVLYRAAAGKYGTDIEAVQSGAALMRFRARAMTILGLAGMYWLLMHDDDDYKGQTQETRDMNLIIPSSILPGSVPLKMPKPFEVGFLLVTVPEAFLSWITGDTDARQAANTLKRGLIDTLHFNPIPQAGKPLLEGIVNHSFWTGRNIVPQHKLDLEGALQYTDATGEFSRVLGSALNYSPSKIEHMIRGYSGTLGSYGLFLVDQATYFISDLPDRPPLNLWEYPMLRRFTAEPGGGDRGSLQSFYELRQASDQALNSFRLLRREGRQKEARDFRREHEGIFKTRARVLGMDRVVSALNTRARAIALSRDISTGEKARQLKEIKEKINKQLSDLDEVRKKSDLPAAIIW